ncbi:uncharacterized protein PG998_014896 [Apiospora kogelbergensis]|uniref:uncharacterized protein n=1 Tax=Apiospora kogelbergensis TaxID=1337665 RepID=UPI00312E674D
MAAPTFSLGSLPVEIQCCIFRHLDPVTLIAVSQTSSHYRRVISPSKLHFAERLLALELTEEHGGTATIFRPKHNIVSPDWRDPACHSMRWACTDCLRLLPHTAFGNHALLGLGYRKPEPRSPAAAPVSSWEPSRDAPHWRALKRHQQRPDVVFEQKRRRAQYAGAAAADYGRYTRARDAAHSPPTTSGLRVVDGGRDEMARFALAHERRLAGHQRRLRRCLECSWRRGALRPRATRHDGVVGGSRLVPLAHSRQLRFGCGLDRYFPGFAAPAGNGPPARGAPVFAVYRDDARDFPFTLHMVRCPRCAAWQELRAFRVGEWWARWTVGYGTAPSFADLALYRLRYRLWQEAWARHRDDEGMGEFGCRLGDGFREEEFNLAEEHFRWLERCRQEVLENPQVLVDWALARDGAALT